MSARIQTSGEFEIVTATLSLSYAFRILFLYRVLYVFKGLAPTWAAVSLPPYCQGTELNTRKCQGKTLLTNRSDDHPRDA